MISNNSRADVFDRCNREYYLSFELLGTGLVTEGIETYFGDGLAGHAGLASWYTTGDVVNAINASAVEYRRFGLDEARVEWGAKLLRRYIERDEPKDDFVVLEAETSFIMPLGERHHWVGRSDLIVKRNGYSDSVHVLDHKTTKSNVNTGYIASFDHSMQLIGYALGVQTQNPHFKVAGYGVNILKKLERQESYDVDCSNCKGTGALKTRPCSKCGGRGRITKEPNQAFIRKWFTLTPNKIDRFKVSRERVLDRIEAERDRFKNPSTAGSAFPMNPRACHLMRSGGSCLFANLCWNANVPANRWWDFNEAHLSGFKPREPDYVTLAEEELD